MRFEKTSLKPILAQLLQSYPSSNISISDILSAYHDTLNKFDLGIVKRAGATAPSRHPRFFPNAGELYVLCRELYEREREQAKQIAESVRLTQAARDADRRLTPEESKAIIAHILAMLGDAADMRQGLSRRHEDDAYDFIEDKSGKWAFSRQITSGGRETI